MPADIPESIDHLLARAGLSRLEARVLMSHASGRSREWLIAHGADLADPACRHRFKALAARRRAGEPIAYLVGQREFRGLTFKVDPAVLIPRPETELLVDLAIEQAGPGAKVLDLGTGSGAIAVALAHARPDLRVVAGDRDSAALRVAVRNALALLGDRPGGKIDWREGSWWSVAAAAEGFDIVLSNPPYIAENDPHLAAGDLRFEPRQALAAGADGLADLREIVAGAPSHLNTAGLLMVEHGWDQGPAVRQLMIEAGFIQVCTVRDVQQHERITSARMAGLRSNPDDSSILP